MRSLWTALAWVAVGCVPAFESVPCYGVGECPAPAVCVHRRCLIPPADMAVDQTVPDAGPIDELEGVAGFGANGRATLPIADVAAVWVVRRSADDGLVIGGQLATPGTIFVARVTAKGALDDTFADGGVFTQRTGESDRLADVQVQADGQIVLLSNWTGDARPTLTVQRLTADGLIDLTYGDGGALQVRDVLFVGGDSAGVRLALTPSGRARIVGITHARYPGGNVAWTTLIAQLNSDGQLDPLFGDAGVSLQPRRDQVQLTPKMARLTLDGALLLAGNCGTATCTARILADGTYDRTHGVDGIAVAGLAPDAARFDVTDGVATPAGLVVTGVLRAAEGATVRLARLELDGDPDLVFGDDGFASLGAPASAERPVVQAHCGGVELAVDDGRVWRFDATGARTHTLDAIAPPTLDDPRTLALGDGAWVTVSATPDGLEVVRFATQCAAQGN